MTYLKVRENHSDNEEIFPILKWAVLRAPGQRDTQCRVFIVFER
jgi:hypothetical protein